MEGDSVAYQASGECVLHDCLLQAYHAHVPTPLFWVPPGRLRPEQLERGGGMAHISELLTVRGMLKLVRPDNATGIESPTTYTARLAAPVIHRRDGQDYA